MLSIRTISREKLYEVFKTDEQVKLMESILYQVGTAIPADTASVQESLNNHIANPVAAHMATAIGNSPAGGVPETTVQGAINGLDATKQPKDATLTALAALATVADRLIYATGVDAFALTTFTAFARSLLDDVDAAAMRTTLGIGTIATQAASNVAITGGTVELASGSLGYATGNGGTVTQLTSKSTGVTLNKIAGEITLNNAALAAGAIVSFVLTDSAIAATDVIERNHVLGGTIGAYTIEASAAAGSATFYVRNNTAGSLGEALVIRFAVLKSANS